MWDLSAITADESCSPESLVSHQLITAGLSQVYF